LKTSLACKLRRRSQTSCCSEQDVYSLTRILGAAPGACGRRPGLVSVLGEASPGTQPSSMSSIHTSSGSFLAPLFPCVHWMQFLAATHGKSTSWFAPI
jgi:hypothetical protein